MDYGWPVRVSCARRWVQSGCVHPSQSLFQAKGGRMRVETVTLRRLQMRLKAPFETSFGATYDRSVLLIELQADGLTGWSEITAMETPTFNPETVSTSTVIVRDVLVPAVLGKSFASSEAIP